MAQREKASIQMDRLVRISITTNLDVSELDPEDLDEDGECSFLGERFALVIGVPEDADDETILEHGLEAFHQDIGIANLDDFEILPALATDAEDEAGQVYYHEIAFDPERFPEEAPEDGPKP